MLTEEKKEYFKNLLDHNLNELLQKIEKPISGITVSNDDILDFTDQATLEEDTDFAIHMKERVGKLILKLKKALERIEDGTFGICEECGEEISEGRLKARPVATLCINCKREQEFEEKRRGV